MRAGAYTVHQSLTAAAAAVLKLALGLARRRGHAQVTPLHVAYTLLIGACSESSPSPSPRLFTTTTTTTGIAAGLLMRACARSRSAQSPAQCRALELCFNVALNRLPTQGMGMGGSSPSTSSLAASLLQQPSPTLSNALVAALKRAQANQRRGCVEMQSQPSPPGPPSQQQQLQPPVLTIKVELDQLIISILDDPSVSRVMREAGFSSAAVKTSLEEESTAMLLGGGGGSSTPHLFQVEPYGAHASGISGALWAAAPDVESSASPSPCNKLEEDVRAILEVMLTRRQGRGSRARANPVVVSDSASVAEASIAELLRRMERGDVPDELRGARVLRLRLFHAHVRLMTRADVDAWAADLRRSVVGVDNNTGAAGLVIYVGDMRWAVVDDDARGLSFSPAAHLAEELARVLRAASHGGGRAWLVAAASYVTFMQCQRSTLDVTWDLQPVPVPAGAGGGLDLELGVPRAATASPVDGKEAAQPAQFPLLDPMPTLCVECAKYYENEASVVRAKAASTNLALSFFPGWQHPHPHPQEDEPQTLHKDELMELKRKWSRLCQLRVHSQSQWNQPTYHQCDANATISSNSNSNPAGLCLSFEEAPNIRGRSKIKHQDVKTTLSLLPDSICHESEGMDEAMARPAAQEPDQAVADMKSVPAWLSTCEPMPPSGDLKRKAEGFQRPSDSKRRMGGGGDLDLNLRADDDDEEIDGGDGSGSSEDELVPSNLTNDGEGASGDVTDDSFDSHRRRHAAVTATFNLDH